MGVGTVANLLYVIQEDPNSPVSEDSYDLGASQSSQYGQSKQLINSISNRQRSAVNSKPGPDTAGLKQNANTSGLKPPMNENDRASSGDDSLLDLYRSNPSSPNYPNGGSNTPQAASRKRVASRERSKVRRKGSRGAGSVVDAGTAEFTNEDSKWIHRDKLAQIESRELAEMGLRVGRPSRANSGAKSVKTAKSSVDIQESTPEVDEEDAVMKESRKLQEVVDEDVQASQGQEESEIAITRSTSRPQDRAVPTPTRPGTSRIPVPTSTPGSFDDDSPLEMRHKRSESFGATRQRTRSRSDGSQNLLDHKLDSSVGKSGMNGVSQPNSPQSSPSKERSVSKGTASSRKTSGPRKASGPQSRSRANSQATPSRPGTSGGSRPPTARPEGEAPWIATMYKPDPLLPPDQQMLPTHAKRMAQMQAEAEAKTTRDQEKSEFHLEDAKETPQDNEQIALETEQDKLGEMQNANGTAGSRTSMQGKRSSMQQKRSSLQNQRESGQWPLRTPSGHHYHDPEKRISPQSGMEHGGYNLMPSITSQSEQEKRQSLGKRSSQRSHHTIGTSTEQERQANAALAPVHQPVRLNPSDEDDSGKKKKGCGCCVIM